LVWGLQCWEPGRSTHLGGHSYDGMSEKRQKANMSQHGPIFGYQPVSWRGMSLGATMFNKHGQLDQSEKSRLAALAWYEKSAHLSPVIIYIVLWGWPMSLAATMSPLSGVIVNKSLVVPSKCLSKNWGNCLAWTKPASPLICTSLYLPLVLSPQNLYIACLSICTSFVHPLWFVYHFIHRFPYHL